jgi:hypothetical protein
MAYRHTLIIIILTLLATSSLSSQQESDPNRLFVRVQTHSDRSRQHTSLLSCRSSAQALS